MNRKWTLAIALLLILALAATAHAHGAAIQYTLRTAVEIRAAYDSGEPMSGAQVTVYAPGDPATPWLTGVCDAEGRFAFSPDPDQPGTWDVQVRSAGHGDMVHIPVGAGAATTGGSGYTPLQYALMGGAVVWGCVGTALYFSGKRTPPQPEARDAHP